MENKNIFLGKIQKSGCYVNNGKSGYFLTCQKKNYKIPEWLKPEEITLDMAIRLIEYNPRLVRHRLRTSTASHHAPGAGLLARCEAKKGKEEKSQAPPTMCHAGP